MQSPKDSPRQAAASSLAEPAGSDRITADIWRLAIVVLVGSFMSIMDMTIVNVGLHELNTDLNHGGSLDKAQWIITAYMLAVAAVIPVTGWASNRIGNRRLWIASISLFTLSSALCATATSIEMLTTFRVIQGVAGGMLMPIGQIILARAAGPKRMGRVMGIIGVPMLLAPVAGPVLGGLILDSLPWEWIFIVNVPVGVIGVILALRILPKTADDVHQGVRRTLDVSGLLMVATGMPAVVYGLANIASKGISDIASWGPIAIGVALIAIFVRHAWDHSEPLLNVKLFCNQSFAMASLTTFTLGAALFGPMILFPIYFQTVRGEDVLTTGLLMAPQGIGAAIGMAISGRLTDRIGGGIITVVGLLIVIASTYPFTQLDGSSSYLWLSIFMVLRGVGFGSTMMPSMAAAFASIKRSDVEHATPQLTVIQRVGGAAGTALLATILGHELAQAVPSAARITSEGAPMSLQTLSPQLADTLGGAYGTTFWWVLAASVLALAPAIMLTLAERRARHAARRDMQIQLTLTEQHQEAFDAATTGAAEPLAAIDH